jgi:hypothetical protein
MTETHEKEIISCLKFEMTAQKRGAVVSKPTTDFVRYDYIVDWNGKLYRVQVKYCGAKDSKATQGACQLQLRKRKRDKYTKDEIDALVVYMPRTDKVYWFGPEVFDGKTSLCLRYGPTKDVRNTNTALLVENYVF